MTAFSLFNFKHRTRLSFHSTQQLDEKEKQSWCARWFICILSNIWVFFKHLDDWLSFHFTSVYFLALLWLHMLCLCICMCALKKKKVTSNSDKTFQEKKKKRAASFVCNQISLKFQIWNEDLDAEVQIWTFLKDSDKVWKAWQPLMVSTQISVDTRHDSLEGNQRLLG